MVPDFSHVREYDLLQTLLREPNRVQTPKFRSLQASGAPTIVV